MQISVIIPTFNEASHLPALIEYLLSYGGDLLKEVIVADGGSNDDTVSVAKAAGAVVLSSERGRAVQMNAGAAASRGTILFFIHADVVPPPDFALNIIKAHASGNFAGTFRSRFAGGSGLLHVNAWLTRFRNLSFRGGDQGLFITRDAFNYLNGFDPRKKIMEDYDILQRIIRYKRASFVILPDEMLISTRKYEGRTYFRVMLANVIVFACYRLGVPDERLIKYYRKLLGKPK